MTLHNTNPKPLSLSSLLDYWLDACSSFCKVFKLQNLKVSHFQTQLISIASIMVGILFFNSSAIGQTLAPADSLFLQKLRSELQLPDSTLNRIDSIYKVPISRLQAIDKEVNRIARMDIPQSDKDLSFAELRAEKKSLKEDRDLSIQSLLTAEQQTIYLSKVVPAKPAVLHMGTNHDRASCVVCVKPQ
ncbi:MAG: hypothetical protein RLZZ262_697 [Bacteroidota bacterium]|jgi:hypothetical protein